MKKLYYETEIVVPTEEDFQQFGDKLLPVVRIDLVILERNGHTQSRQHISLYNFYQGEDRPDEIWC